MRFQLNKYCEFVIDIEILLRRLATDALSSSEEMTNFIEIRSKFFKSRIRIQVPNPCREIFEGLTDLNETCLKLKDYNFFIA